MQRTYTSFFQKLTSKALHFGHENSIAGLFFKATLLLQFYMIYKNFSKYENAFISPEKNMNRFSMKAIFLNTLQT